jgi:ribonuclease P protein component
LLVAADFDPVFRQSQRSADQNFTVLFRPNRLGYARVGLAIAKKRVRRAVDRNRLKRLIRESFRNARPELDGLDIVVLARNNTARADNATLFVSLERHWQMLRNQTTKTNKGPALN